MVIVKLLCRCVLLLFVLVDYASAGTVYKCKIDGRLVFTDKSCEGEIVMFTPANAVPSIHREVNGGRYNNSTWYYEYSGYRKALSLSKKNNVPIFIYFHAEWCKFCRKLEKELINTSSGDAVLSKVIKVKITPEKGQAENDLFKKLGGRGYPSIFIQKSVSSDPKKYYLMSQESGSWSARSVSYLSDLIDSQI
jgi:thiol-disulfide isomerase/thioredoxin